MKTEAPTAQTQFEQKQAQALRAETTARQGRDAPPPLGWKTAPAHLFVGGMLTKQRFFFNLSPPVGPQVLEVAFCLLLTALFCPARSEVFMCQWAMFSRGTELNINSPRHTMLREVELLKAEYAD